jgi:hypothetical protein
LGLHVGARKTAWLRGFLSSIAKLITKMVTLSFF